MKKELKNSKTSASSRDVKLLAYCAMAGGAFVAAQPANAAIVYSGVKDLKLTDNGSVALDLDGGGVIDFEFKNLIGSAYTHHDFTCYSIPVPPYTTCTSSSWYGKRDKNLLQLAKNPQNAIGGFRNLNTGPYGQGQAQKNKAIGSSYFSYLGAFNLAVGTPIPNNNNLLWFWLDGNNNMLRDAKARDVQKGMDSFAFPLSIGRFSYSPAPSFVAPKHIPGFMSGSNVNIYGTFANGPAGYLGVRFDMSGNTHYGWVRYQGTDEDNATTPTVLTGTIIDWAYEAEPDTPIFAGDRGVCQDKDGDGYGLYCSKGPDCDDNNAKATDNCSCADEDGDGYGVGPGCKAADCDDTDNTTYANCPTCTVKFFPSKLSKFISMMTPLSGILINGDEDAEFTKTTKITWGTKNISTVLQVRLSKRTIISLVVVNNAALVAGDIYDVRVGDCAGDLEVR